ncbi:hypothetical protein [Roseateles asaccharophilus]|uniref:hypothetical protein n=1 Tax=Roseateles asaccharophilus TaxID=582607 RepID=UPI00384CCD77
MHDVSDVVMGAIHQSFDGRTLDAATLGFTLVLLGIGVLKDAKFDHIKERVKDFIDVIDLKEIRPFTPPTPS